MGEGRSRRERKPNARCKAGRARAAEMRVWCRHLISSLLSSPLLSSSSALRCSQLSSLDQANTATTKQKGDEQNKYMQASEGNYSESFSLHKEKERKKRKEKKKGPA